MDTLFTLLFLASLGALLLGLVRPGLVRASSRGRAVRNYGLVALGAIIGIGVTADPVETPSGQATEAATSALVAETPEPPPSPEEQVRAALVDALRPSNRDQPRLDDFSIIDSEATVRWAINDNLTAGLRRGAAQSDAAAILAVLSESNIPLEEVVLQGTFPMVDLYGNTEESTVVRARYSRAVLDRVNWEGFFPENVYTIADEQQVHREFR